MLSLLPADSPLDGKHSYVRTWNVLRKHVHLVAYVVWFVGDVCVIKRDQSKWLDWPLFLSCDLSVPRVGTTLSREFVLLLQGTKG